MAEFSAVNPRNLGYARNFAALQETILAGDIYHRAVVLDRGAAPAPLAHPIAARIKRDGEEYATTADAADTVTCLVNAERSKRGLRAVSRDADSVAVSCVRSSARLTLASSSAWPTGFSMKSTAPAFIA